MLVSCEIDGAVATITLDNPPVNALSSDLLAELGAAVDAVGDGAVRVVVITGSPRFSAGADISGFRSLMEGGGSAASLGDDLSRLCRRVEVLEKPTIAAIRGFAYGGGLELALACDFRVMSADARVGQPEVNLGVLPGAGGTQRLARLIGLAEARRMVLTGEPVDARRALELGLADRVVPDEELAEAVAEEAGRWATAPTRAIGFAKRALTEGFGLPIDDALALETEMFRAAFETADAAEGVAAFLEKRDPGFQGA
jgi:enoyl-CoA hydratase/carnithine racemase